MPCGVRAGAAHKEPVLGGYALPLGGEAETEATGTVATSARLAASA